MTEQEIRETFREMLVNWDACMQITMRDAGKSPEEAEKIVRKLFDTLVRPK